MFEHNSRDGGHIHIVYNPCTERCLIVHEFSIACSISVMANTILLHFAQWISRQCTETWRRHGRTDNEKRPGCQSNATLNEFKRSEQKIQIKRNGKCIHVKLQCENSIYSTISLAWHMFAVHRKLAGAVRCMECDTENRAGRANIPICIFW